MKQEYSYLKDILIINLLEYQAQIHREGRHHFDVLYKLVDPKGRLGKELLNFMNAEQGLENRGTQGGGRQLILGKPNCELLSIPLHQNVHRTRFENREDFGSGSKPQIVDGVLGELHDHLGSSFSDRQSGKNTRSRIGYTDYSGS